MDDIIGAFTRVFSSEEQTRETGEEGMSFEEWAYFNPLIQEDAKREYEYLLQDNMYCHPQHNIEDDYDDDGLF